MDTDIYICSKPLQYFNVRNIGYGNASSKKVLIILGHFRDAELFFHQVKTFDDTWNDILYFKDLFHLDLYLFFIQSDIECPVVLVAGVIEIDQGRHRFFFQRIDI